MKTYLSFKRIKLYFLLWLANLPMPGHGIRPWFVRLAGVNILDPKHTFIGKDVKYDGVHPELITIESGVRITGGTTILTHYIDPATGAFRNGEVRI